MSSEGDPRPWGLFTNVGEEDCCLKISNNTRTDAASLRVAAWGGFRLLCCGWNGAF